MHKDQLINLKIKNIVKSFLDEDLTPAEIRLQAAKGLIPLETKELVSAFYYFLFDSEDSVKYAARESIETLPERMLLTYLTLDVPAKALHYFAKVTIENEKCLQAIILNKNTATETLAFLAPSVSEKLLLMIADNQEKIIEAPEIIDALEQNPNAHISLIEKLRHFMKTYTGTSEEGFEELSMDEMMHKEQVLSGEDAIESFLEEEPEEEIEEEVEEEDYTKPLIETPSDGELESYSTEEIEEMKQNTWQRIQTMNIAEKIQEAMKGSRESRGILIKDANKIVSSAVMKSPKMTEDEVVKVTASKNVSEEILRIVCLKDEWLRNYNVKLNLVNNPKTPFRTTIKFMSFLHKKDLIALSKSKMVPSQVAVTARKMAAKKQR